MRPSHYILIMGLLGLLVASLSAVQDIENPQAADGVQDRLVVPLWVWVLRLSAVGVGLLVLIAASLVWFLKGRLLQQVRVNFTPWGILEVVIICLGWLLLRAVPVNLVAWLAGWAARRCCAPGFSPTPNRNGPMVTILWWPSRRRGARVVPVRASASRSTYRRARFGSWGVRSRSPP